MDSKEFFHAPYDLNSYILALFMKRNFDEGRSILNHVNETIWIRDEDFYRVIDCLTEKGFKYIAPSGSIMFESANCMVVLQRSKEKQFDRISVYSESKEEAHVLLQEVKQYDAEIKKLSFCWLINKKDSVDVVEEWEESVTADLYPYVKDFDTYAQRFINSKANILILIGEPGTGKTTFIKHLMDAMDKRAYLTYDESVLSSDGPFAEFLCDSSASSFIIEDADLFLKPRADGNGMMSRFLNIGDGIIKLKNKKLIFSTNLPSTKDMDHALTRPGRCFDILSFRALTKDEARRVAHARDLEITVDQDRYTLAEIFNGVTTKRKTGGIGFTSSL